NRIPSILASCRFLAINNKSSNAKINFDGIINLMSQGISQNKDNSSVSISINSALTEQNKKRAEDDFSSIDLVLTLASALDYEEENQNKTEVEQFIRKFETICKTMDELKEDKKGYYWDFLVPYFIEMKKNNLIEPFANIVFL